MRPFELLVMFKPGMADTDAAACRDRVAGWIKEHGGVLEEVVDVGELPLAYPIKKQNRGRFMLYVLAGPPELPAAVAQRIRVDEEVLRHLLVERHAAALKTVRVTAEDKEKANGKRSQPSRIDG